MKNNQKGILVVEIVLVIAIIIAIIVNVLMIVSIVKEGKNPTNQVINGTGNDGNSGNYSLIDKNEVDEESQITIAREEGEFYSSTTTLTDINEEEVVIPKGFKIATDSSATVDKGIVIEDEKGNQFVWVPVADINEMAKLQSGSNENYEGRLYIFTENNKLSETTGGYGIGTTGYREPEIITNNSETDPTSGISYDADEENLKLAGLDKDLNNDEVIDVNDFKLQLQSEFNDMVKSVSKYKGFYIGRYETGDLNKNVAVVKKGNTEIANQDWYTMYKLCKTVATNSSVNTHMIWGCQWDGVLRWFSTSTDKNISQKISTSDGKGNYDNYYVNATGSNDEYSYNNIFDMAGNVYERTMECSGNNVRVIRGGSHKNNGQYHPISFRGQYETTAKSPDYGTRTAMYISIEDN